MQHGQSDYVAFPHTVKAAQPIEGSSVAWRLRPGVTHGRSRAVGLWTTRRAEQIQWLGRERGANTKKRIRARENERKGVKPAPAEG